VDVLSLEEVFAGEVGEGVAGGVVAGEAAVVGSDPHSALGVFAEAFHDVALHAFVVAGGVRLEALYDG